MPIRVLTLVNMARKGRSVYRVRRRGWDKPKQWDSDGEEHKPWTWARWEEDWFTNFGYAVQACSASQDGWGRVGYMDQCKAERVLRLARGSEDWPEPGAEVYENGRHRVVYSMVVENERRL